MPQRYIIYRSRAKMPADQTAMQALMDGAFRRNQYAGITGFIARDGEWFVQYLEGRDAYLQDTVIRIRRDRRHRDLTVLAEGPLMRRMMPDTPLMQVEPARIAALMHHAHDGPVLRGDAPLDLARIAAA
ncbi:MAG: BLUF domain-containing protein [Pseudomonadota bacterium]